MKLPSDEQILESCIHGVIATDAQGRIISVNEKARDILKHSDRFQMGIDLMTLLPVTGQLIHDVLKKRKPHFGHQAAGKEENLIVSINVIEDKGEVIGAVCSFVEMSEFKAVAHKLDFIDMLEKKFQTVFHESFDGIWLCDGSGNVLEINKSTEKLLGIPRSEVVGKSIKDLFDRGYYDKILTYEVIRTKRKISQLQTATLTGKRLLCTGIPVLDNDGEVSLVIINERDVSQLIETQNELEEMRQEKDRYRNEIAAMAMKELQENSIVAENKSMQRVMETAVKFAQMEVSEILILGESGTGKGLTAKFIHQSGPRASKPFIQINCAAIPETILEAELFGYDKGAFTGAKESGKPGLIELANEGTLFLDEIGELSMAGQAKLLKYLDDHEVMRIGGTKVRKVDCIVISATNQNLEQRVEEKKFRADLLFRLNSLSLTIPPLRERPEDIIELTHQLLHSYNEKYRLEKRINPLTLAMLQTYAFPGNVRELKNLIKKGVVMSDSESIDAVLFDAIGKEKFDDLLNGGDTHLEDIRNLDDIMAAFEKELIKNAMKNHGTTRDLALYFNTSQPTIVRKLKKYGLSTR